MRLFSTEAQDPLSHPAIVEIAKRHGKTTTQVILRWHVQIGVSAIPKSFTQKHIAENFNVFDFTLGAEDMATIDALDTGHRSGPDPEVGKADTFLIKVED